MSFKLPFDLLLLQNLLPTVDLVKESLTKVNPQKTVDTWLKLFQPIAQRTQDAIAAQVHLVLQMAAHGLLLDGDSLAASELPHEYVALEHGCDSLFALYSDLVQASKDTFSQVSYDYPPGNAAIARLRDAHLGQRIGSKWSQLKSVLLPQELEKVLTSAAPESSVPQPEHQVLPKTLHGHLSHLALTHAKELDALATPLAAALRHLADGEEHVAVLRRAMDSAIVSAVATPISTILATEFTTVTDLRKKVYHARAQFDSISAKLSEDPNAAENPEWIQGEDDLVAAIEHAVTAMKRLLFPAKSISLLRVFVQAQYDYFSASAAAMEGVLSNMDKIEVEDEEDV